MTDFQKVYLRGLQYEREKKKSTDTLKQYQNTPCAENTHTVKQRTCERLAEKYKLKPDTIRQDAKFAKSVDEIGSNLGEDIKEKILNRDIKITKKDVVKIARLTPEEQMDAVIDGIK